MTKVAEAQGLSGRAVSPAPATLAPATFYAVEGGDLYWRLHGPAEVLGAKVAVMTTREANAAVFAPNRTRKLPWQMVATHLDGEPVVLDTARKWADFAKNGQRLLSLKAEFPEHEGAAVFRRPCIGRATLARTMRTQGIRAVAEVDDNYFANPNLNVFLRGQPRYPEQMEFHAKAMASMEANVFSTALLRDRYWAEYKRRFGKRGLPEMFVCRNNVPSWHWPERIERDGPLRVGFMGSNSHVWDINLAYPAFAHAHHAGCETTMIGYSPAKKDDLGGTVTVDGKTIDPETDKAKHNRTVWSKVIDNHVEWVPSLDFRRQALPLDIGLCPLRADDFTLSKSDVKAVEYTVSGAAVVAMNNPVYNGDWKHEVNCLLAGSPREMAEQTMRLVKDKKLRFELVAAAQEMVASERNEHVLRSEWEAALAA